MRCYGQKANSKYRRKEMVYLKTIVISEFKHETNSFMPIKSDLSAFKARNYLFGDEIFPYFRGVKNELGAFIDCYDGDDEYRLIPAVAFNAQPGGIVTREVFDAARNAILETVKKESVDGILLALHGAMVVEGIQDGEGELLESIRNAVGADVPIIASLDLHCNLTKRMIANANAFFPYDYYPHTDTYDAGLRAAQCMKDTLEGRVKPVMEYHPLDMLLSLMPTAEPCMAKYVEEAQAMRGKDGLINVNILHGFFAADIYEVSLSVVAVADEDKEKAKLAAERLANKIWAEKDGLQRHFYDIDDAIDEALRTEGPVVFADTADNPGSGATGDSTHMLRRMLERGVKNAAAIIMYDPETVEMAVKSGVGSVLNVRLGGKTCPDITGGPIECKAYVRAITDGAFVNKDYCPGIPGKLGTTAVLDIEGIRVVTTSIRTQPWDMEALRCNGISPEDFHIIVVKSTVHFRASFGKIAKKIYDIELPALGQQTPKGFDFKNVKRPIYPLDNI